MRLGWDIWQCAILPHPMADLLRDPALVTHDVRWLGQSTDNSFFADPFGWADPAGGFHVYAERYDYLRRHGTIEYFKLNADLQVVEQREALREPWHLSYPYLIDDDGWWMLPEAHRSGGLRLYRMGDSPAEWIEHAMIDLPVVPVDATVVRHGERWWMFYSPATSEATRMGHLHAAFADRLTGPWTPHPMNPLRVDRTSSRPGGTPIVVGDQLVLPVQDCSATYGGGVRPLWIDRLDETGFDARASELWPVPSLGSAKATGMHTIADCGSITLVDIKRRHRSIRNLGAGFSRLARSTA